MRAVGIRAVGMYEPPIVRRNDWWPAELVRQWVAQRQARPRLSLPSGSTPGEQRIFHAMVDQAADPFLRTVERRVVPPELSILDIQERAARDAIGRAGIDPAEIDLVLCHSIVHDHQLANPACPLHERLGLLPRCLALHTEATAYTSLAQIALAEASIAAGRNRCALLVQSTIATRFMDQTDPSSVLVGDAATAIVLTPAETGQGILGAVHYTEGRYPNGLVMSVPGGRWYDDGSARIHIGDPHQLFAAEIRIADICAEAVHAVLARTGYKLTDIDFLCVLHGTPWLQRVVYEELGIEHIQPFEVFHQYGYLSSAAIPAALFKAAQAGKLTDNALVVIVGGGTGMTYGATALRWIST